MTFGKIILPGRLGQAQGEIPTAVQGSRETVSLKLVRPDGAPFDLTGAVLTGTFAAGDDVYEVTGDLTPNVDQTGDKMGLFAWARSVADVGTAGEYQVQVHVSKGGLPYKSFGAAWTVAASQDATAVAPPGMVGVSQEDADWLANQPQVRGFFMQRDTIEAGETVTIPAGHAMVTTLPFTNDGRIQVDGRLVILGGAAEASRQEFGHAAATAVYNHNLQRENVHGIADTRLLETQAGAQARADAAAATAVQRANHIGTQLLATISDAGTMAAQSTASYYGKSDFDAAPTSEKPLKSDNAGGISFQIVTAAKYRIGNYDALQMPTTGRTLVGHTTGSGSNMTCVGYYAGYARSYADSIAIGAYANPTKANQAVIGGDGGYGTSQINALTVVSGTSGGAFEGNGKSSTTAAQPMARIAWSWNTSTHATRKADLVLYARDYGGEREGLRIRGGGTEVMTAVNGAVPVARQLLATGAGASVDDVIAVLQNFGIAKQS